MSDTPVAERAVLYCDGGFLHEKKIGGWGVHGYTFFPDEPKKGTGNPKAIPTDGGYYSADTVGNKVTVHQYVDMIGGAKTWGSNNEVEAIAVLNALIWLRAHPEITDALILSDSKFAVIGTTEWLGKWVTRNWLSPRGEPIKYRPTWEKIKVEYDALKDKINLKIKWVKGHDGEVGNTRADLLATRGIVLGKNEDDRVVSEVREAQGYWKVTAEVPRILQAPRWYFSTSDDGFKREDGSFVYYVGSHGTKDKEDDLAGKPYADNFLGVVRMKEPEPVLEKLRESAMAKDPKRWGALILGHLDLIFSPRTYTELSAYGATFLQSSSRRQEILDAKDNIILTEQRPIGQGFKQVDAWRSMTRVLDEVISNDPYYRLTDITDLLYEEQGTKKTSRKLKAKITQIVKYLDIDVEYNLNKEGETPEPFIGKTRLILGSDILTRNQLAALSEDVSSVKVVSWRESDNVARYATLVELTSGDIGLWARTEANIYLKQRLSKP